MEWLPLFALCLLLACVLVMILILQSCRTRRLDLQHRAVLITGCDSGFGHALARRLAEEGVRVMAACLSLTSPGALQLQALATRLPHITTLKLDVTKDDDVSRAREDVTKLLGDRGLWALVNNAGVAVFTETEWCPLNVFSTMMEVNWLGMVRVTKAFLPLVRQCRGRVVNVTSMAGRCAIPGFNAYASSKFAAVAFTDSLRREMVKFGVKVISIEPALYRTALLSLPRLVEENEAMWNAAPADVRRDYGEDYFRSYLVRMEEYLAHGSSSTVKVIDAMTHAVTSVYPCIRYTPSFPLSLASDLFCLAPNVFQDWVLRRILHVPCQPQSVKGPGCGDTA